MKFTSNNFFNKTQLIILCILATTTFITKFIVAFHPFDVLPRDDELYYLFFSENLRLVYPDHTPMVAYFLAFARFVFNLLVPGTFEDYLPGSLALVPISSTIYFLFLYAFIYFFVAHVWKNKPLAILLVFTFLLTPYLWGISFLTTPETPLTFFAFPAVLLFAHAFLKQPENLKVWLLAGFFLAGAFLGKILAIPLGISIALYAIISPKRKLYLTNYRFYLAFTPAIIAGLVVLYADYLDNFSMIKYLFLRNSNGTNIGKTYNIFFNQFIYYTPLFFLLVLFLPIITVYKNIRGRLQKKKSTSSMKEEEKSENFTNELLFFLAILSVFCTSYYLYKLYTIFMLNWWSGFTAGPNILFICVWLQKKISSSQKKSLQRLTFANFVLTGLFCILATFQAIYGVLDPKYNPNNASHKNQFPSYNTALNIGAHSLKKNFGRYPEEFGDWLHKYYVLTTNFKKYYEESMDKSIPIVGVNFRPSLYIHYYVQPNHKPMALTVNNSKIPATNRDKFGLFNSLFNLDELNNKPFYLVAFHTNSIDVDIKEYEQDTSKLPLPPYNCQQIKIFEGTRVGKPVAAFPLYYCQNGSSFKKNK